MLRMSWDEYVKEVERQGLFFNCLTANYNGGFAPKKVKKYLIHKHGRKCSLCGLTEWMGQPIPLTLDHIDGNSDNWNLDNLRLLCGNCDRIQPTYAGKNKGRGKSRKRNDIRLKRYYEDKKLRGMV